jgi:hypothetical protein
VPFPAEVNEVAARTVAAGVATTAVVAVASDQPWLAMLLAYGFVARVLAGPRYSPLAQLATRVVAPRLGAHAALAPGPPKRFAQAIGATMTVGASCLFLAGEPTATLALLGVLTVPALLEAAAGYCIGCRLFAALVRLGLVPDSVCVACADLYGQAAETRRAARAVRAATSAASRAPSQR